MNDTNTQTDTDLERDKDKEKKALIQLPSGAWIQPAAVQSVSRIPSTAFPGRLTVIDTGGRYYCSEHNTAAEAEAAAGQLAEKINQMLS